jgi:hypothetical protein
MYWHKKPDRTAGGLWRCRIRRNEVTAAGRDRHRAAIRERQLAAWHAPEGGWLRRRLRRLTQQRTQILTKLDQLREDKTC